MSAHAIRNDGECDSAAFRVREKAHTILLLLAVTLMLGNAGINIYRHYAESPRRRPEYHDCLGLIQSGCAKCCVTPIQG